MKALANACARLIALSLALVLATAGLTMSQFATATPARAAGAPIYNSIPAVYPPSFSSLGYQAQQTSEFGDHVVFAGTNRVVETISIGLNDWACESDFTLTQPGNVWVPTADPLACVTTPGSTFVHPITLNIYEVDNSGLDPAAGAVIASITQDVDIPFRPSADALSCGDRRWFNAGTASCHNGFAFNVDFDLTSLALELPDEAIVSIAYNTQSYGAVPIASPGPFNSLNVSLATVAATVGAEAEPDVMFRDFGGSGFLRETGWSPFVGFVMNVSAGVPAPATAPTLAATGFDASFQLIAAALLLLSGCLVLAASRRKPARR